MAYEYTHISVGAVLLLFDIAVRSPLQIMNMNWYNNTIIIILKYDFVSFYNNIHHAWDVQCAPVSAFTYVVIGEY